MAPADAVISALLVPLGIWIVLSGFDDILIDAFWAFRALCRRLPHRTSPPLPDEQALKLAPELPIAIFVPAWREARVIGRMIEQNVASIQYRRYRFFVGIYPNDTDGIAVVSELAARYPNVHLALCPHEGPTSKADCLNWIYQRLLQFESQSGEHFEIIMTHDAEDVVHGQSLRWVNYYARSYAMVQVPVLPLRTPLLEFTHGVYADEFSEYQMKDMPARQFMRAFVPSNGVGTGFRRDALEALAARESNRIFEPTCLTEDYENGLRIHAMGMKQYFIPLSHRNGGYIATREFFPQSFRTAVRQRTRWVTGIALQTWERHGWKGDWKTRYWLWRDRKGLIGSPLSSLTNAICIYGVATWGLSRLAGTPWGLAGTSLPPEIGLLTLGFGAIRIAIRAFCVGRVCGWVYAMGTPLRMFHGNLINSAATLAALYQFGRSKWRREPLRWLKTEHAYPSLAALEMTRRRLGEILVGSEYVSEAVLESALATQPESVRIGEHLVSLGALTEDELYEALSLQQGLPVSRVAINSIKASVAHSLPAQVLRHWRVLPFKIEGGRLFVAGPEPPNEQLKNDLRRFTRLELRFHLVTPGNFAELAEKFL